MKIEIPAPVLGILKRLRENGYEGYIVGGCVRDMLLGREPEDWDITTSALPAQVKALFRRTIDTGIQHGTVTVMIDHAGYEVTTYRVDGNYSDGRHPDQVTFTPSLIQDLKRRDFTINAMAYSPANGLVDEFKGQEDLKKGVIRCVGDPMERFSEDALRMLRAIRFSAQLGFQVEERTLEAVRALAPNLAKVSRERIQVELTKLLMSRRPEQIRLVYDTGLAPFVGREFGSLFLPGEMPVLSKQVPARKALRWAAFLRESGPDRAEQVLKGLKLDNDTISQVKILTKWFLQPLSEEKPGIRRAMNAMGTERYLDLLDLKEIFGGEEVRQSVSRIRRMAEEIVKDGDCLSLKELAVSGRDILRIGNISGPQVGKALNELLALVLEEPKRNSREYLLKHLNESFIMETAQNGAGHCKLEEKTSGVRKSHDKEDMKMNVISTEKAPGAIGPYSQAYEVNGVIYTSGQIPVNPADGSVPEGIAAQAEQSCKNVGAILEAAGSSFDKVFKTTCFLADMGDFGTFNEVYAKYFASKPARSCVAVKDLPKGVLCEIEAIAVK